METTMEQRLRLRMEVRVFDVDRIPKVVLCPPHRRNASVILYAC